MRHDQLGCRSRRPWRTLFERTLGSLPYGAVLSLAGENGEENLPASTATAAAGKVVWASEGFEKLAGVDAIDVVGQEVGSLFEVGGTEEDEEGEEAGELKRSLEIGQGCTLWMTMGEQQDGLTNVLCVHQPVTVPPQLSEEGRYSVLLFFDTASVLFENPPRQATEQQAEGGEVRGQQADSLYLKGKDQDREQYRQRTCYSLSRAMATLLADNVDVDIADGLLKEACVSFDGNNDTGYQSETLTPSGDDKSARIVHGRRRLGSNDIEGEAGDVYLGGQRGSGEVRGPTSQEQRPLLQSKRSGTTYRSDDVSRYAAEERKGEYLRGDLLLESGIVDEQQHGASHIEGHLTSSGQLENGRGSRSGDDDEEEGRTSGNIRRIQQHRQQQPQYSPAFSAATESGGAAEYSSGDESSTEPRDDLLTSPGREEATAAATVSPAEPKLFDGGDERIDGGSNSNVHHGDLSNGGGNSSFDRSLFSPSSRPPVAGSRISLDRTQESEEEAGTDATTMQRKGSDDPYEDDFCCDEEDESLPLSLSRPEQEEGRVTVKNISSDNTINHGPDNGGGWGEAVTGGHRGVDGGFDVKGHWQDDKDDSYSSSSSDGVYSGTVAGGLKINLHGGGVDGVESERDDNDELTWEGSPEGSSAHHSYHNPCQEGQEINVDGDATGFSAVTDFRGGTDGSSPTDGVSRRDKPP
ncbi:expressed unknown protein [Ectocarpus siliculosus]|uniref:PAS domain-containing protein n=1 Tax=Ectocarpus siliculosus TaxID=2880 RepID=D7G7J5_ECTSI|nr:expressed unknown protein [Ectocarpus siliculosus]|eukprot:CBJ33993.1 expressed unknown protein [Ectocarpus siliculosus]